MLKIARYIDSGDIHSIDVDYSNMPDGTTCEDRNDWKTFEAAQDAAERVSKFTGEEYIAIDGGEYVAPRYDVIRMPQIGDDVSKSFNGDYYPQGQIAKISKTRKVITTTTGARFYRRGDNGGAWVQAGTWSLTRGHTKRWNESF